MATKTLPHAIWTPWARVLCADCNNVERHTARKALPMELVTVEDDRLHVTRCDQCEREIGDPENHIAGLHNLAIACGLSMEQTGGMCSAAVAVVHGCTIFVTDFDAEDVFTVSLFDEDWNESEEWGLENKLLGDFTATTPEEATYIVKALVEGLTRLRS